ncbi:MAG: 3-keto-disaccharide hydrolase [Luteimonas sp.]
MDDTIGRWTNSRQRWLQRATATGISGLVLALLVVLVTVAAAANKTPPAELTEQWQPLPPVVSVAADGVPSDAIVLFDGGDLDAWTALPPDSPGWKTENGAMLVVPDAGDVRTKQAFGSIQLHLEWRSPAKTEGVGQARGNSGVFFMGLYELQVLDSYRSQTYVNGQAASIYKQYAPLVNASRPPGEWQSLDAMFIAPTFSPDGALISAARMTVLHNGVLVQHDTPLRGATVFRGQPGYTAHAAKLPLQLQDHGQPVAFRNIWVREIAPAAFTDG